jgi:hypothetical protein
VTRFIKIGKRATDSSAFTSYINKTRNSSSHICALWKRVKKKRKKDKEREERKKRKKREKEKEKEERRRERKRRERKKIEEKKEMYDCDILLDITIKGKFYLSK